MARRSDLAVIQSGIYATSRVVVTALARLDVMRDNALTFQRSGGAARVEEATVVVEGKILDDVKLQDPNERLRELEAELDELLHRVAGLMHSLGCFGSPYYDGDLAKGLGRPGPDLEAQTPGQRIRALEWAITDLQELVVDVYRVAALEAGFAVEMCPSTARTLGDIVEEVAGREAGASGARRLAVR
jgi:hypothetical protein